MIFLEHEPTLTMGSRAKTSDILVSQEHLAKEGIAAQTILMGATEKGLGGCILGSIQRDRLREELDIPGQLKIRLVVDLGKPAETVVLEDVEPGEDIRYWRDQSDIHHVPKRTLEELILS